MTHARPTMARGLMLLLFSIQAAVATVEDDIASLQAELTTLKARVTELETSSERQSCDVGSSTKAENGRPKIGREDFPLTYKIKVSLQTHRESTRAAHTRSRTRAHAHTPRAVRTRAHCMFPPRARTRAHARTRTSRTRDSTCRRTQAAETFEHARQEMSKMQRAASGSPTSFLLQKFTIMAGDRQLGVIGEQVMSLRILVRTHFNVVRGEYYRSIQNRDQPWAHNVETIRPRIVAYTPPLPTHCANQSIMQKLLRDHVTLTVKGSIKASFMENILRSWRPHYWGCQSFNLYDNSGAQTTVPNPLILTEHCRQLT